MFRNTRWRSILSGGAGTLQRRAEKICAPTTLRPSLERLETRALLSGFTLGQNSVVRGISAITPPAAISAGSPVHVSTGQPVDVSGTIDPGQASLIYRVVVGAGTSSLNIVLNSSDGITPLNESIVVLDATGRTLADAQPLPGATSLSVDLNTLGHRGLSLAGQVLYLKVSPLNSAVPTPRRSTGALAPPTVSFGAGLNNVNSPLGTSDSFVLTFVPGSVTYGASAGNTNLFNPPKSNEPPAPVATSGTNAPQPQPQPQPPRGPDAPVVVTLVPVAVAIAPAPAATAVVPLSTSLAPVSVATGPLPSRAIFFPTTGLEGDSRSIDRANPSPFVDMALMDLPASPSRESLVENEKESQAEEELTVVAEEDFSQNGPVVSLRGPGGFPLFGTTIALSGRAFPENPEVAQSQIQTQRVPIGPAVSTLPSASRAETRSRKSSAGKPLAVTRTNLVSGTIALVMAFSSGLSFPMFVEPASDRRKRWSVLRRYFAKSA